MDKRAHLKRQVAAVLSLILVVQCSIPVLVVGDGIGGEGGLGSEAAGLQFEVLESGAAERLVHLIGERDGRNLVVSLRNSMSAPATTLSVDCNAYSSAQRLLSDLGTVPTEPTHTVIYWMNLDLFFPSIGSVSCNVVAGDGISAVLRTYDSNNLELSYLLLQWSVDERGFSIYNSVTEDYSLYQNW